jgi:two-component system, NarL family, nitrate/nitrite response regulator NarL
MPEIRILMVDDHSLFRESLCRLLEANPHFRVVGQCATVAEALAAFSQTQTDVVLLDYDLGEESGFGLIAELKRRQSEARVLMVTAGMSDELTLQVMESGASGVFLKHGSSDKLVAAIEQIATGEICLDSSAVHCLLAGRRNRNDLLERTRPLTVRQSEVLRGILDGLANKEIAWKMKTSESSVKAVIQELFHKAGVRTRSQLVRIAIEKHTSDWLKFENRIVLRSARQR